MVLNSWLAWGQSSGTRGGGSLPRIVGMIPVTISSSTTPKLQRRTQLRSVQAGGQPTAALGDPPMLQRNMQLGKRSSRTAQRPHLNMSDDRELGSPSRVS